VFQAIDISNWSCKTFLESIPKNYLIFQSRAVRSIVGRVFVENVSKRKKLQKRFHLNSFVKRKISFVTFLFQIEIFNFFAKKNIELVLLSVQWSVTLSSEKIFSRK
jgi:hypothetical protein